ncbi:MAG: protein-glutamine glutaminase family protein [Chloroflexia bacterium]
MPNPNAIVSIIIRLDPPLDRPPAEMLRDERGLSVELDGGRRARLDPADPRSPGYAQVLDGLRKQRLLAYLEIDPDTSTITQLLIPHVSRVLNIRAIDQGVFGVELELSHARHVLRSTTPDFADLEKQLRDAVRSGQPVILTEDDAHNIIDVRPFRPGPDGPTPPFPKPRPRPRLPWPLIWIWDILYWIWCWPWWPWWWFRCISMSRAQEVFDAMKATSCNPLTVPPPCIPFLYPDDGCWGRAHEMCRLMIDMGLSPKKVWIQGGLSVSTKNNPTCYVWWGWHVAPTLCVRGRRFFLTQTMVIDPSLFTTPVSKATWKSVQGDPAATLTDSAASIFYLWGNATDPTYTQTNQVLATYRLQLQLRSINQGPPPYANCP